MPRRRPNVPADHAAFVRCRTLGHGWDAIPVTDPPSYGVALDLRCVHCGTVRRDVVSRSTAALLSRRYDYPDHYRDAATTDFARQDWRALWITTLDEALRGYGTEPEPPALRIVRHEPTARRKRSA